jgi:hypothetical protein
MNSVTIRARAALYLAVTENLFGAINQEDKGYVQARKGLDLCWMWVEGEKVEADSVYEYLTNEDDVDVLSTASATEDLIKSPAWDTTVTALYYVIWQIYQAEGERYLPADVDEVNEEIIYDHLSNAKKSERFQENQFEYLKKYLLKHYPIEEINPLGKPIGKATVLDILTFSQK